MGGAYPRAAAHSVQNERGRQGSGGWIREAGRIRIEDNAFGADLEAVDRAVSTKAVERLEELRAVDEES